MEGAIGKKLLANEPFAKLRKIAGYSIVFGF
jgi:hypothetical protein